MRRGKRGDVTPHAMRLRNVRARIDDVRELEASAMLLPRVAVRAIARRLQELQRELETLQATRAA